MNTHENSLHLQNQIFHRILRTLLDETSYPEFVRVLSDFHPAVAQPLAVYRETVCLFSGTMAVLAGCVKYSNKFHFLGIKKTRNDKSAGGVGGLLPLFCDSSPQHRIYRFAKSV
jgi:hypothetical protein